MSVLPDSARTSTKRDAKRKSCCARLAAAMLRRSRDSELSPRHSHFPGRSWHLRASWVSRAGQRSWVRSTRNASIPEAKVVRYGV